MAKSILLFDIRVAGVSDENHGKPRGLAFSRARFGRALAYAAAMLEVGAKLPKLTLRDADERAVSLASLHAERPLAAIFLRHFG